MEEHCTQGTAEQADPSLTLQKRFNRAPTTCPVIGMVEAYAELRAELITFQCKECYVYRPPPASSIGHRAELWDVDHWLHEVSLRIVTCDEECTIKLFDVKSGALFAECNVPPDAPLSMVSFFS